MGPAGDIIVGLWAANGISVTRLRLVKEAAHEHLCCVQFRLPKTSGQGPTRRGPGMRLFLN